MKVFLIVVGVLFACGLLFAGWWHGPSIKRDERPPFQIDPDQPYRIEFGRGSGWHGLDTIKITQDGQAVFHRQKRDNPDGVILLSWESTTVPLPPETQEKILVAVDSCGLMDLHRSYSANIHDGTQWVLWIKQGDREKSVYFDNHFPRPIVKFAKQLDEILYPHLSNRTWNPVPESEGRNHARELWDSIKR